MEVIADPHPIDTALLGSACVLQLLPGPKLLTGQEVADLDVRSHVLLVPGDVHKHAPPGTPESTTGRHGV